MSRGWNGKEEVVEQGKRDHEELPEGEPTVLSAREAMSLISPTPEVGFLPEQSTTSDDGDDRFENRDSASA